MFDHNFHEKYRKEEDSLMKGNENKSQNDIRRIAYQRYQFHWMMTHGISLSEFNDIANDWWNERLANLDNDGTLLEHIEECGFSEGKLWACYGEFLVAEYKNESFICNLLNGDERELYLEDIKGEEKIPFAEALNMILEAIRNNHLQTWNGLVLVCSIAGWRLDSPEELARELMWSKESRGDFRKAIQKHEECPESSRIVMCNGIPVIKDSPSYNGTNVPVHLVLSRIELGLTHDEIADRYQVSETDINACLRYVVSTLGG